MTDTIADGVALLLARKREWHRQQAHQRLREKVRILLELQRQQLPLFARQRPLRPWERPWNVTPPDAPPNRNPSPRRLCVRDRVDNNRRETPHA